MRIAGASIVALGIALLAGCTAASDPDVDGPSWTGRTKPREVISARQELMEHIEELMEPIDTITIQTGPVHDVERLHQNADVIGAMLAALPHLFPSTTDLYDPKVIEPKTLALPTVWKDFDSFYRLAGAARAAAERMGQTEGDEPLRDASRALRSSCDGCHELFLRKYVPPRVLDSDREFDFSRAFP